MKTLREWQQMPETPNLDAQLGGPQYMGPATFMKVTALTEPAELDQSKPDVAIVGAPWDGGTTYRPGARFGPRAVRVRQCPRPLRHPGLQVAPFEVLTVIDYGDAACYPRVMMPVHEPSAGPVAHENSRKIVPIVIGVD